MHLFETNDVAFCNNAKVINVVDITNQVKQLESWFCKIHEPKPKNEEDRAAWEQRQHFKHQHKYSKYFDPDLLHYVPMDPQL